MKKITFLVLLVFVTTNIYSQIYTITFAAGGAVSTLDSIEVENLTQNTHVVCDGDDVLQLVFNVGINNIESSSESINVFPNPMQDLSEISFFAKQPGVATLSIYDITGKLLLKEENTLLKGIHKYNITGLKQGVYLISIIGNGYFYTSKIISHNTIKGDAKIQYIGSVKQEVVINNPKSTKAIVDMDYAGGDSLKFTGYSGNDTVIVKDVPTGSKTIIFTFDVACESPYIDGRDGNVYPSVIIGNQCWFAKNLAYLPSVVGSATNSNTTPCYYVFGYNGVDVSAAKVTGNYTTYGVLYNWPAAMAGSASSTTNPSSVKGVCPEGWHLPSDAEWTELTDFLSGTSVAGGKLKETGTVHWMSPNTGATDEFGFTALPGGDRITDGTFNNTTTHGYWWTTTEDTPLYAWNRGLYFNSGVVYRSSSTFGFGFSVRCVKD